MEDYLNYLRQNKEELSKDILKARECIIKIKEIAYGDKGQELAEHACEGSSLEMEQLEEIMRFLYTGRTDADVLADSLQIRSADILLEIIKGINIFNEKQLKTVKNSFK